jgi:hypothetical protein
VIYEWRTGARQSVDAQKAGERLERLRAKHGGLTAQIVVADARSMRSPLHDDFEWDDERAAHEFRLEQARDMLANVTVRYEQHTEAQPVRAFLVVSVGGENKYESTYTVMSDVALRQQVLIRALRELESWRKRYADLEEFASLFSAIEPVLAAAAGM